MSIAATLRRAVLFLGIVVLPVLSVSAVNAGHGTTIEAPAHKKMGMGLVLLVSLQRA